jgi:hypothetical protein
MKKNPMLRAFVRILCLVTLLAVSSGTAHAVFNKRFDVATFCCPCTPEKHLCQNLFDKLNWKTNANSMNGHMILMGTDAHRAEVNANGNFLGAYYNDLNTGWTTMTGVQKGDQIQATFVANFPGGVPTWIALNEISNGTWPNSQAYRTWVGDVVQRLKNQYGHETLIFSPFYQALSNNADWQRVASYAYIVVENYLSGQEVNASGNSISWCQSQYQVSKTTYMNRGVPASKIYLAEIFAQTVWNTGWGRSGASYAGWDNAIFARAAGARNVGFSGFVSYSWDSNAMLVSDTDIIHFAGTYNNQTLP